MVGIMKLCFCSNTVRFTASVSSDWCPLFMHLSVLFLTDTKSHWNLSKPNDFTRCKVLIVDQ